MTKKTIAKCGRISLATLLLSGLLVFSGYSQFVTTWKSSNSGTSSNQQITIPGTGNYTVKWERVNDPNTNGTVNATGAVTINFPFASTYKVTITGGLTQIKFANGGDKRKLLSIEQWGNIAWTSMEEAFSGCRDMVYNATDIPDLSRVTSLRAMFRGCSRFDGNIGNWNTSNITDMSEMFTYATTFNQPIGNWNTSNVTNMESMFQNAVSFNQPIGNWNTSNVTNMRRMFLVLIFLADNNVSKRTTSTNSSFNQPIGNWDVSKVTNMESMFTNADRFNQPLNNWNTQNVTNMAGMFSVSFRTSIFNQPLNNWNVSKVKDMSSMFLGASNFNQNLGDWDITSVTNMTNMISGSGLSLGNYDRTLIGWATQNVQPNITFNAAGLKYCAGEASRTTLTNASTNNWNIINDMKACPDRDIEVQFEGNEVSSGGTADFGASNTTVKTFTIRNLGTTNALNLSGSPIVTVTAGTAFAVTQQPGASTIAPDGSLTFKVSYTAATSNDVGTLSIVSNDPDETTYTVELKGSLKKIDQVISFTLGSNVTKVFGDANFDLTATGGASGNAITFTSSDASVATISGNAVTIVGIGTTTITARQAGNDNYNAAINVTQVLTVNKANQTITFSLGSNATKAFGDATFDVTATGGASGNVVTFTSSNANVATISDRTVTIVGVGTTTITARQAGNNNYNAAADVTQTLTVNKADQTITFDLGSNTTKTIGDAAFDLAATGGASGNAITFTSSDANVATISGNTVTIVGAGITTITALQAGNNNYNAATNVTQTLTVNKVNQTITFDLGNDATKTFGNASFDLTATGGASGNAVTFTSSNPDVATISGSTVTIVGVGTTIITASQSGNDDYDAATDVNQTLTVQSTVTSLPQQLKSGEISIFPNPVSDMLRIKITQKVSYNYVEITLSNHQGKKVLLMGKAIKNGQIEIPVAQLAAGEYLLHISTGGETIVRRFVKL